MTKRDLVVASTRHHPARLLEYYPRPPCAPSFVKSRMLRPLQTHFLHFQQIFFVLVCIHPGTPRVPPRVLASGPKPLQGQIDKYGSGQFRLAPRGIKQKKLSINPSTSPWFLLFYSLKPRSQERIVSYWNWSRTLMWGDLETEETKQDAFPKSPRIADELILTARTMLITRVACAAGFLSQ